MVDVPEDVHGRIRTLVDASAEPVTGAEARSRAGTAPGGGRHHSLVWLGAAALLAVALVGSLLVLRDGSDDGNVGTDVVDERTSRPAADAGWLPIAAGPLSPRAGAVAEVVGDEVVVLGGSDAPPCPLDSTCDRDPGPILRDAAAYDPSTDSWRSLPTVPDGVDRWWSTAVVGDDLYLLGSDGLLGQATTFLVLRPGASGWEPLAVPGVAYGGLTATADGRLVAWRPSDAVGDRDEIYDPSTGTWSPLPEAPLPASFDRAVVAVDGDLLLVEAESNGDPEQSYGAARLEGATAEWRVLAPEGIEAHWRGWFDTPIGVVNPTIGGGRVPGAVDPATGEWAPLPGAPSEPGTMSELAPAAGDRFVSAQGWVYDLDDEVFVDPGEPAGATVHSQAVAWVGDELFVWGGVAVDEGGAAVNSAQGWMWRPPSTATTDALPPPDPSSEEEDEAAGGLPSPELRYVPATGAEVADAYVIDGLDDRYELWRRSLSSGADGVPSVRRQVLLGTVDGARGELVGAAALLEVGSEDLVGRIDTVGERTERHSVRRPDDVLVVWGEGQGDDPTRYEVDIAAGDGSAVRLSVRDIPTSVAVAAAAEVLDWYAAGAPAVRGDAFGLGIPVLTDDELGPTTGAGVMVGWCIPRDDTDEPYRYVSLHVSASAWNPGWFLFQGYALGEVDGAAAATVRGEAGGGDLEGSVAWTPQPGVVMALTSNDPDVVAAFRELATSVRPASSSELAAVPEDRGGC